VPIIPLLLLPAAGRNSRWSARPIAMCAALGMIVALLAVSVSYLEDQVLGADLGAGARTVYYERIRPAPGRAWNRYRMDFVPFVSALGSSHWLHAERLGQGPDLFPLHMLQARREMTGGQAIPIWLVWAWPACWLTVLLGAGAALFSRP
jgi:hypothetical protein